MRSSRRCTAKLAVTSAERVRERVEAKALPHPESSTGPSVTVSVGHVSVTRHNIDRFAEWTDVVETADKALYRAKQSGRNRVEGPLEDA